jgi:hypothetical protein
MTCSSSAASPVSRRLAVEREELNDVRPPSPPTDRNVQVIVEIEARAATVERLFMISERHGWTFGQALEYSLDALELALAKTATG